MIWYLHVSVQLLGQLEFIIVPVANPDGYLVSIHVCIFNILLITLYLQYAMIIVCRDCSILSQQMLLDTDRMSLSLQHLLTIYHICQLRSCRVTVCRSVYVYIHVLSLLGSSIPSIECGGRTLLPPATLPAMELTLTETLTHTGARYHHCSTLQLYMQVVVSHTLQLLVIIYIYMLPQHMLFLPNIAILCMNRRGVPVTPAVRCTMERGLALSQKSRLSRNTYIPMLPLWPPLISTRTVRKYSTHQVYRYPVILQYIVLCINWILL